MKYSIKNLSSVFTRQRLLAVLLVLNVVVSCLVICFSYGLYQSYNVVIEEGAYVKDSIIMEGCHIKKGAVLNRVIVDQNAVIGENVNIGEGENIPNERKPKIYNTGITVIGSATTIPDDLKIGKNCVIYGHTTIEDYENGALKDGGSIVKEEVAL